ncbi:M1 family aminopeptidase [soil metagenome]
MTRAAVVALLVVITAGFMRPQNPVDSPGPGVPLSLAQERAGSISDLRYQLHWTVPDQHTQPVSGRVVLTFDLKDASRPLALDFAGPADAVTATAVNGHAVALLWSNEHLIAPSAALVEGRNVIVVEFRSADGPLNRSAEFMYALFVPARARQAFPCFDQPDLKARYSVSLDVPAGWQALTNGAPAAGDVQPSTVRRTVKFAETKPISTYLFTFAAGRFKVETADRAGRTFRMLHRETDAAKVARNREAIFDLHAGAIAWLEKYTGIDYPFDKFDFLLVPAFQFGGMEHPGAVYYKASSLLLDPSATQEERLGRASLISHETSHMWFGDLVTMKWFNDVWTKEVFANFMAAKIVAPAFPEVNHELRFLYAHYPGAYDVDRTEGSNAIRQELANLNEAGSLYGAIVYQKAPIVMRQLETIVGAEPFRDGLREYLKLHAYANATWHDLIAALDPRTPEDLVAWSRAWVEEAGRPTITTTLQKEGEVVKSITLTQTDPIERRGLVWSQRLQVWRAHQDGGVHVPFGLGPEPEVLTSGAGSPPLTFALPNARGLGYGNFVLDAASRGYLLGHLPELEPALLRGSALITLWEEMLDGRVPPTTMMDLLLKSAASERDELNVGRMLSYTRQAYWKFLAVPARAAVAPRLEQTLRAGLNGAANASLKSTWFNALRDTAPSAASLQLLERVWRKQEEIPGLTLAEPDFITLAQALAVKGVPSAEEILEGQIARTENPDRKAQMIFVRPALSRDQKTRDAFFATLSDAINRRRETWVLEALGYLHHPLRAASSEKYIAPSLQLLQEIQRTGDIFFPKRWADATLSGHRSTTAAKTVRDFLATLPGHYPDRLRRVVLSSADDLFRVR